MVRHTLIRTYYILLFVVHNDVKVTLPTKANGYKSSAKPMLLAHNLYIFSITFDKLLRKIQVMIRKEVVMIQNDTT